MGRKNGHDLRARSAPPSGFKNGSGRGGITRLPLKFGLRRQAGPSGLSAVDIGAVRRVTVIILARNAEGCERQPIQDDGT